MLSMPPLSDDLNAASSRAVEPCEIDPGIESLVLALQEIGCQTEASCEGHLRVLTSGEPCTPRLPYVDFRAPGPLVNDILELITELVNRPPSRTRLAYVWYLESCPSRDGGILHTLTPHYTYSLERLTEPDLEAAQRDSRTLSAFFLLRRGSSIETGERASQPIPTGYYLVTGTRRRVQPVFRDRPVLARGR